MPFFVTCKLIQNPYIMRFLAVDCPDCITNVDLTDKNSIIACAVTVVVGAIIRYIEKRKDRKKNR